MMHKVSERLETWYAGGEKGLFTLCDREDVPQSIKDAARHWYSQGRERFDVLVGLVRELEEKEHE